MTVNSPKATLLVREHRGQPFYEAFWRFQGKQVKTALGLMAERFVFISSLLDPPKPKPRPPAVTVGNG